MVDENKAWVGYKMVTNSNPIMQHFTGEGEDRDLRVKPVIWTVATRMDRGLPESTEKSAGMRKLLEAQDCFLRAAEMDCQQ